MITVLFYTYFPYLDMIPILKNILAVAVGLIAGSLVNGGIIMVSGSLIPPPLETDNSTMEGLAASMHLYEPKHFIFPFLAHSLGSFAGAFLTAYIAINHHLKLGIFIGLFFLVGGIIMVVSLPSPLWFTLLDLIVAYIPMAYLGTKLATTREKI